MGGVRGKIIGKTGEKTSADVILEFCEFHSFPVYRDVQELLSDVKSGKRSVDPQKKRLYWWVHKSRLNGAVTPYEYRPWMTAERLHGDGLEDVDRLRDRKIVDYPQQPYS